jgi:hypothetical protein
MNIGFASYLMFYVAGNGWGCAICHYYGDGEIMVHIVAYLSGSKNKENERSQQ